MSLFVTAIGMVITLALTKRGSAKVCAVLLLCAAVCAAGYTVSPIHRNQQAVAANAVRKQENIDRLVAQGKAEFGDQGYAYLTYAYDEYLGGTVERYGLEATAEMYGYSTKAADITNVRTIKINYCRLMLNTEPLTSRLFGLSYDEMTYHGTAMTWKMTSTASRICTAGRGLRACWLFWGISWSSSCARSSAMPGVTSRSRPAPAALRCAPPSPHL